MDPQLQALLAELRDIHRPGEIAWWPPAPGWWVLGLLLTGLVLALIYQAVRRYRARAYQREGLAELEQAYANWQAERDDVRFLNRAAVLLRRLALFRQGRSRAAQLTGEAWRRCLISGSTHQLSPSSIEALTVQQYRPAPQLDVARLFEDLRRYIQGAGGTPPRA